VYYQCMGSHFGVNVNDHLAMEPIVAAMSSAVIGAGSVDGLPFFFFLPSSRRVGMAAPASAPAPSASPVQGLTLVHVRAQLKQLQDVH